MFSNALAHTLGGCFEKQASKQAMIYKRFGNEEQGEIYGSVGGVWYVRVLP